MIPNALNIKGGSKEPLSISFDDNVGVTITSHQKLTINADDDIIMKTPKNVKITATSQLLVIKTGTSSGFSMETDVHFLSDNVIRNGRDREAFAAIDNTPPKPVKKPDPPKEEKKKGFDWGKLATNVLAGLAVVALVTVAAVAIAVTCGAAAPLIGAIAIGAGVAGTAAVASQAISDYKSGEVSDMSTYMAVGAREAFIGAVSGAIFGPFGATEALGGKMLLGGVTNGFESIVRQKLNGEDLNWRTVLFDTGIGMATGGLFHGAGKMFEKASPFAKNAFNKISSEISENTKIAKIALSNMEKGPKSVVLGSNLGNVDEALGRFGKEFKKVKNEIKSGTEGVSEASNNKIFTSEKIEWTATRPKGTQQTYEIYQRNDIDWDMIRTSGDKNFMGKTNAEAAGKGLSPQLSDGNFSTLHHIGQDSRGAIAEASTRYHGVGKYGQDILHSQYGRSTPNPDFPIDRKKFGVDTREYWKWRVNNK